MFRKMPFLLSVLLPLRLAAQTFSCIIPASELESKGLNNIVSQHPGMGCKDCRWVKSSLVQEPILTEQYQLFYQGIPIKNGLAALAHKGSQVLITASIEGPLVFKNCNFTPKTGHFFWVFDSSRSAYSLMMQGIEGYKSMLYRATDNSLYSITDERRFYQSDTWVKAKVFRPDPLTTANVLYGGVYTDRHDSTYPELENQQLTITLPCNFRGDSFRLENQWLSFGPVSDPKTQPAVSVGDMLYTRNDVRFEEVNAFYHINQLFNWWDSLGFSGWKDTVVIDAHAYEGADESAFNPLVNPPTIEYGDGGVDDAEDADAAIHEYTHCAFHGLQPNGYNGTQRQGIEEGICDFMAVAYSLRCSPNQAGWVYNWDGHNEFWAGRTLVNNRTYPKSLTNQPHVDGQLFGGALYDLASEIGMDSAVKITLMAMPLLLPNINMPTAAYLFLQTDSLLNEGRTRWPLIKAFYPRGLLPGLNVQQIGFPNNIWIRNSEAFAQSYGDAYVFCPENKPLQVLGIDGKLLRTLTLENGKASLSPSDFKAGIYIIRRGSNACTIVKF